MLLRKGSRLGHYDIVSFLGAGGMGEVWRARDTKLDRDVALKALPLDLARDEGRLARFEREAKLIAALNHSGIVVIHSIEEADGVHFLTMELLDGDRLDELIEPGGLPLPRVLEIAIPLTEALVAAHEKAVIHRDLKPGNVMVTREGRVKVLDFGLAKLAAEFATAGAAVSTVVSPLTEEGRIIGTVPYMAPEQLRGRPVDARTDIFALGVILYEMLTGSRPFSGDSPSDISSAILRDAPAAVNSVRSDLPRDSARIVGRCLEKDPRDRFQTARDVYNELRFVKRELDQTASRPSSPAPAPAASKNPPREEIPSIAVIPFVNMSRDEENEYFADGLSEELLNVLAKIRGLRVAARTSSFSFKGKNARIADIGRDLNVATLLEGSVRKSGKRVRITAQLVKVSDGYHLWSETYDRELEDIFAVQDDIAQRVLTELRTALLGERPSEASAEAKVEVAAAAKGRAENTEAHRLCLQGRFFVDRQTKEDVERGIGFYKQAIELDPGSALAWAGLSWAYSSQAGAGWAESFAGGFERSREAAERALSLEPDLAEGLIAIGRIQMNYDWNWKAAEASFARAMELAPGNSYIVRAASTIAANRGRLAEAIALAEKAAQQDPLSEAAYRNLASYLLSAGRWDEAEDAFAKAISLSPRAGGTRYLRALMLVEKGRQDEALSQCEQETHEAFRLLAFAAVLHRLGRLDESEAALQNLIKSYSNEAAYQIAEVYADRGDVEHAFEWLEVAYRQRDPGLTEIRPDSLMRSLHGDPRWKVLLERLGLAD